MTNLPEREKIITLIDDAVKAGARRHKACALIGLSVRTVQRWRPKQQTQIKQDLRPLAQRPPPAHRLSAAECETILQVCNSDEYAHLPPSQIVPKLADQGVYLASESSFYRLLRKHQQLQHRSRAKARQPRPVTTHTAYAPNQLWSWDITYLPTTVSGQFFYLYMVEDVYSRYGVVWEVYECESGEYAADLMEKAVLRERLHDQKPILHSDNGAAMKSMTLRAKLDALGIARSFSRPRVSDDNAYIESFFRTLKYAPMWSNKGFSSLQHAREWVQQFMDWYNHQHQHSQIRFVTPAQRHLGQDTAILAQRAAVYEQAKNQNPQRWSKNIRDWSPVGAVTLNPDKAKTENRKKVA